MGNEIAGPTFNQANVNTQGEVRARSGNETLRVSRNEDGWTRIHQNNNDAVNWLQRRFSQLFRWIPGVGGTYRETKALKQAGVTEIEQQVRRGIGDNLADRIFKPMDWHNKTSITGTDIHAIKQDIDQFRERTDPQAFRAMEAYRDLKYGAVTRTQKMKGTPDDQTADQLRGQVKAFLRNHVIAADGKPKADWLLSNTMVDGALANVEAGVPKDERLAAAEASVDKMSLTELRSFIRNDLGEIGNAAEGRVVQRMAQADRDHLIDAKQKPLQRERIFAKNEHNAKIAVLGDMQKDIQDGKGKYKLNDLVAYHQKVLKSRQKFDEIDRQVIPDHCRFDPGSNESKHNVGLAMLHVVGGPNVWNDNPEAKALLEQAPDGAMRAPNRYDAVKTLEGYRAYQVADQTDRDIRAGKRRDGALMDNQRTVKQDFANLRTDGIPQRYLRAIGNLAEQMNGDFNSALHRIDLEMENGAGPAPARPEPDNSQPAASRDRRASDSMQSQSAYQPEHPYDTYDEYTSDQSPADMDTYDPSRKLSNGIREEEEDEIKQLARNVSVNLQQIDMNNGDVQVIASIADANESRV